jgi:hypothetical protein
VHLGKRNEGVWLRAVVEYKRCGKRLKGEVHDLIIKPTIEIKEFLQLKGQSP